MACAYSACMCIEMGWKVCGAEEAEWDCSTALSIAGVPMESKWVQSLGESLQAPVTQLLGNDPGKIPRLSRLPSCLGA